MAITDSEGMVPRVLDSVAPIGDKLKALREADGLKLAVVADAVGTTIATLSAVETSRIANPGYQLVFSLAKYYGVTVEELVEGSHEDESQIRESVKLAQRLTPEEDETASSYLKFLISQRVHR